MAVAKYPTLYHCYVGIGQLANMAEGEALSYRWTLEQAREHGDQRAVDTLVNIGPPPYTLASKDRHAAQATGAFRW